MPFICSKPESYHGVIGTGQCAVFVEVACKAPRTTAWTQGAAVKGAFLARGTAIATFVNGKYPNLPRGNHAAIYAGQNSHGIQVFDQYVRKDGTMTGVEQRTIRFKGGHGSPSDDGDAYSVIEQHPVS